MLAQSFAEPNRSNQLGIGFPIVVLLSALLIAVLTASPVAAAPAEVVGLFKDRAVIRTAAGQKMLRVGETSPDGVQLLSADTSQAKISYRGQVYTLGLSARVNANFAIPTEQTLSIPADSWGQYRVGGTINGRSTEFLVDTGASIVVLSEVHAQSMSLSYLDAPLGSVTTAQGVTDAHFVTLDEVAVGNIRLNNVKGTVILGDFPVEVLLGMSFLKELRMQDDGGVLTLTAKY